MGALYTSVLWFESGIMEPHLERWPQCKYTAWQRNGINNFKLRQAEVKKKILKF